MITEIEQLEENGIYSYADYLTWRLKERLELIKGKIMKMSPAPGTYHQRVSLRLTNALSSQFEENACELFVAPFDVRLLDKRKTDSDNDIYTVVQPDLCIICDPAKIDEKGCIGAPDLIIELLSPGNSNKEMRIKFDLYEEAGVKEYWMVNLNEKCVFRYSLIEDRFVGLQPVIETDILTSPLFPDLKLDLKNIFVS
ncbi:Uma2 family endonuclease [Taibaiella lutea]|uniref:Uma2 family endonuclease n=1 Tax=Taibaiella lutea TaxID=2608001 RepID=A0A5M6CNU9_9BACT|nr:Uma2 family endonuclease [Taibaiella lutea]KAA5536686.1 Uma2 family endonuclease [Taibaiella lutea]